MIVENKKIGLALSGGGIRAAIFHSGVLKYLAEKEMLEQVSFISTVSGASLLMGLIYTFSNNKFPSSKEYLENIFPKIEKLLTTKDLQKKAIRSLLSPKNWGDFLNRGNIVANELKSYWGIKGNLQDIPDYPRWIINGTTRETGKCWRFSKERMGDYITGYVVNPDLPIAEAIAASAAYPPAIDHYKLQTSLYEWKHYEEGIEFKNSSQPTKTIKPNLDFYHITDGGVYDNLGTEAVFKKLGEELRKEINYLIVSDAGSLLDITEINSFLTLSKLKRNFSIVMDQVIGLRLRVIFRFFEYNPNTGIIVKIGKNVKQLINEAKKIKNDFEIDKNIDGFLNYDDVKKAANYPTDLKKASANNFELIKQHGYETIKIQLELVK